MEKARELGILNDAIKTDAESLDTPITREAMASIVTKAALQEGAAIPAVCVSFEDQNDISDWAKDNVQIAAIIGIVTGFEDNTFRPAETATRAQAAVMMERLLNFIG